MIYIIRHGQTENNKAKLLQGRSDIPLNKDGIRQAEAAAKWFCDQQIRIDSVYSSPLIRAVETAKIIAPEAPLFIEERLIEMILYAAAAATFFLMFSIDNPEIIKLSRTAAVTLSTFIIMLVLLSIMYGKADVGRRKWPQVALPVSIALIIAGATLFGYVATRAKIPQMILTAKTSAVSNR